MKTLVIIAQLIDRINEKVGRAVSWITVALVVVVFTDVVMRYAFNISLVFTQELEWHLFAFIFLIGAGYTLLHEGHVRVDILYQRLGPKAQAWINVCGCVLFMLPGCFLIIYTSTTFVADSIYSLNLNPAPGQSAVTFMWEGSPDPGGIPLRFILKSCIPLGFVLFFLQGCSLFIKSVLTIKGVALPEGEGQ